MATQAYASRDNDPKKKVDVTRLAQTQAPGHPPEKPPRDGAENRTPAPLRPPVTTADMARATSWGRSSGDPGDNSGRQGYGGPSSLNPGERSGKAAIDPHGPAGADPVLQNLIHGTARAIDGEDDWQTNPAYNQPKPFPSAHGHTSRQANSGSPGGVVPQKTGARVSPLPSRTTYDKDNK